MKTIKTIKTMKTMKTLRYLSLSVIIILSGCSKDNPDPIFSGKYENGYFITNEGNYNSADGSISFVNEDGIVENDVFVSNNSVTALGDVVQSMSIIEDYAYIVVNNSNKIEVVTADSMKYVSTIDVDFPRYIKQVSDDKAYITTWGDGFGKDVKILDLNTNTITGSIECGSGPDAIQVSNEFAYVCNIGGWSTGNTISVIDINSDIVVSTIEVEEKPNSIKSDANGNVWVLTKGTTEYDENWNTVPISPGSLVKISNNSIENKLFFPLGYFPKNLIIDDSGYNLYYSCAGAVYSFNINSSSLSELPIINKEFYGLGFNGNYIYGAYASSFTESGWSYRYTSDGLVIDSVNVGIAPNGYCFTN